MPGQVAAVKVCDAEPFLLFCGPWRILQNLARRHCMFSGFSGLTHLWRAQHRATQRLQGVEACPES